MLCFNVKCLNSLISVKANVSKPCSVDGVTYQDGDQFKPECSRLCTCQNGNIGCVDLCPDEHRLPSIAHCK